MFYQELSSKLKKLKIFVIVNSIFVFCTLGIASDEGHKEDSSVNRSNQNHNNDLNKDKKLDPFGDIKEKKFDTYSAQYIIQRYGEKSKCNHRLTSIKNRDSLTKIGVENEIEVAGSRFLNHDFLNHNNETNVWSTFILGIDGGGVRGSYPANILKGIEKETGDKICQIFQGGISGTSTGSIIALALACPFHKANVNDKKEDWRFGPYSGEEIAKIYDELPKTIFKYKYKCSASCLLTFCTLGGCFGWCSNYTKKCCNPMYDNTALKEALINYFGDMLLGETIIPVQVAAFNINNGVPVYFNSYDHPHLKLVDVALSSAAAPTYFPPHNINNAAINIEYQNKRKELKKGEETYFIDGGLADNEPSAACLRLAAQHAERQNNFPYKIEDTVFLSIGTGKKDPKISEKNGNGGLWQWKSRILDTVFSGQGDISQANIRDFYNLHDAPDHYYRIQPILENFEAQIERDSKKRKYNLAEYEMDNPELGKLMMKKAEDMLANSSNRKYLAERLKKAEKDFNDAKSKLQNPQNDRMNALLDVKNKRALYQELISDNPLAAFLVFKSKMMDKQNIEKANKMGKIFDSFNK